jgi:hypothetical protein
MNRVANVTDDVLAGTTRETLEPSSIAASSIDGVTGRSDSSLETRLAHGQPMKMVISGILLGVLVACTWSAVTFIRAKTSGAESSPTILVDGNSFGTAWLQGSLTHEVRLKNNRPYSVLITDIGGTCSCIRISPRRLLLAPGREEAINVTFDTGRISQGSIAATDFSQFLTVHFTAPAEFSRTESITFEVTGRLLPICQFDPPQLVVRRDHTEPLHYSVRLYDVSPDVRSITATCLADRVAASTTDIGQNQFLNITVFPQNAREFNHIDVSIRAELVNGTMIEIPAYRLFFETPVQPYPAVIRLVSTETEQSERSLLLRTTADAGFKVRAVTAPEPIAVSPSSTELSREHRLTISITRPVAGTLTASLALQIETEGGSDFILRVPVVFQHITATELSASK